MLTKEETAFLDKMTGWTAKQRNHLRRLIKSGATIAYVVTDRHGRPSNGGPCTREWQVRPGLVQTVEGPLQLCGPRALHGTLSPHKWKGERVWIAGFVGEVQRQEDKLGSLRREIVGEVYPECALDGGVAARLGRKDLRNANLRNANLYGADLYGADLRNADLRGANLYGANLYGADLYGADLYGADLYGANLRNANLYGADLYGADLYGAYCPSAEAVQSLVDAGYEADNNGYLRKRQS